MLATQHPHRCLFGYGTLPFPHFPKKIMAPFPEPDIPPKYPVGCYLIVSPYLQEAKGGFYLANTKMHGGWPNSLVKYCRSTPTEYPSQFIEMIDEYVSLMHVLGRIDFNMASFEKEGGGRCAAVVFGPMPPPFSAEALQCHQRFKEMLDKVPREWTHLSAMFA